MTAPPPRAKLAFQVGLAGWILFVALPLAITIISRFQTPLPGMAAAGLLNWFPNVLVDEGFLAWEVGAILFALSLAIGVITGAGVLLEDKNKPLAGSAAMLVGSALALILFPAYFEGPSLMMAAAILGLRPA